MPCWLRRLRLREISFVDKGANPGAKVVFAKRDVPITKTKRGEPMKKGLESLVELEALGLNDDQKKAVLALLEAAGVKPEAPKPPEEPMGSKADDPEKKPEIEKAAKEKEEIEKRLKKAEDEKVELEKRVNKLEEERKTAEFTKRAEGRPYIPMKIEDQVNILKAASDLPEEKAKQIDELFEKVNKAMSQSEVLKQFGSDGGAKDDDDFESKLAEVKKRDPSLSNSQAKTIVYKENPKLYRDMQ